MGEKRCTIKPFSAGNNSGPDGMISIVTAKHVARIRIGEVILVEKEGRVIHIVTADQDYSVYESMEYMAEIFNADNFYKPLRGLIVNFDHVKNVSGGYIIFDSGQAVFMGRNNICRMRTEFKRYLMTYPVAATSDDSLMVAETGEKNFEKK